MAKPNFESPSSEEDQKGESMVSGRTSEAASSERRNDTMQWLLKEYGEEVVNEAIHSMISDASGGIGGFVLKGHEIIIKSGVMEISSKYDSNPLHFIDGIPFTLNDYIKFNNKYGSLVNGLDGILRLEKLELAGDQIKEKKEKAFKDLGI